MEQEKIRFSQEIPDESINYCGRVSREEIEGDLCIEYLITEKYYDPLEICKFDSPEKLVLVFNEFLLHLNRMVIRIENTNSKMLQYGFGASTPEYTSHQHGNAVALYNMECGHKYINTIDKPNSTFQDQMYNEKKEYMLGIQEELKKANKNREILIRHVEEVLFAWNQILNIARKMKLIEQITAEFLTVYSHYLYIIMKFLPGRTFLKTK